MVQASTTGFNELAEEYDNVWTNTTIGTQQRIAVWRRIDPLFLKGDRVLDLGCGTGVDAQHLKENGVEPYGIDSSVAMVQKAQSRGINAHHHPIEELANLQLKCDGAISNFGALNCVQSMSDTASALAQCIRNGGYLALCVMGRVCLWEMAYYLAKGEFRKAFRRFAARTTSSLGVDVFYPSKAALIAEFSRSFRLIDIAGVGLFVPPSYVQNLSDSTILRLAALDKGVAHWPLLRSLADHRLYIFQRYDNHR
jgi:ubiquinone/menaquinone biosynthesis C-methylase UbiE